MLKKVVDRGKRSKTLSRVNLVENTSKNLQSFLEKSSVQKEVLKRKSFFHTNCKTMHISNRTIDKITRSFSILSFSRKQ